MQKKYSCYLTFTLKVLSVAWIGSVAGCAPTSIISVKGDLISCEDSQLLAISLKRDHGPLHVARLIGAAGSIDPLPFGARFSLITNNPLSEETVSSIELVGNTNGCSELDFFNFTIPVPTEDVSVRIDPQNRRSLIFETTKLMHSCPALMRLDYELHFECGKIIQGGVLTYSVLPGDSNLDGRVDGFDLNSVLDAKGQFEAFGFDSQSSLFADLYSNINGVDPDGVISSGDVSFVQSSMGKMKISNIVRP